MGTVQNIPMSPAQVAEYLQLDRKTVYRYLNSGKLRGLRVGDRSWRIMWSDVYAYLHRSKD
jgi:excisionase family DNA binding protein